MNDRKCSIDDRKCSMNDRKSSIDDRKCSMNDRKRGIGDRKCTIDDRKCSIDGPKCSIDVLEAPSVIELLPDDVANDTRSRELTSRARDLKDDGGARPLFFHCL